RVKLNHAVRTDSARPGDRFTGVLTAPIMSAGATLVPRGAAVSGVVRISQPSGRLKGRAVVRLALSSVEVGGRSFPLTTDNLVRPSDRHRRRNLAIIGGGSGAGALIGGLAGGGIGALIGAGAGAAAGTAGAVITGKKQTGFAAESVVLFRLRKPLRIWKTKAVSAHRGQEVAGKQAGAACEFGGHREVGVPGLIRLRE